MLILKQNDKQFNDISIKTKINSLVKKIKSDLNDLPDYNKKGTQSVKMRTKSRQAQINYPSKKSANTSLEEIKQRIMKGRNLPPIHDSVNRKKYNNNRNVIQYL